MKAWSPLVLILIWISSAWAAPELWPGDVGEEQVPTLTAAILQRYPVLAYPPWSGSKVSIARILERSRRISARIREQPDTAKIWESLPDPISIFIGPKESKKVFELSLIHLESTQTEALDDIASLSTEELRFKILKLADTVRKGNLNAYLTAIGNSLTPEQRSVFFRKGWRLEQRLSTLHEFDIKKEKLASVDWQKFDVVDEPRTAVEVIQRAQALEQRQQNLAVHLLVAATRDLPVDQAQFLSGDALQSALEYLASSSDELIKRLAPPSELHRTLKQVINEFVAQHSKSNADQVVNPYLELREMPPWASTVRGWLGSDCSTDRSFGCTFAPGERVFFVLQRDHGIGYVSGTLVLGRDRRIFRIKDVALSKGAAEDVPLILYALSSSAKELGVEEVMIAPHEWHSRQNHRFIIRERINELISGDLKFVHHAFYKEYHKEFRDVLRAGSAWPGHYDDPDDHKIAHSLNMGKIRASVPDNFVVHSTPASPPLAAMHPLQDNRLLILVEYTEAWLSDTVKPSIQRLPWAKLLLNEDRLPLAKYYARLQEPFAQLNIQISAGFRRRYSNMFAIGHSRAPDAFTSEWLNESVEILLKQLLRESPPAFALQLLIEHSARLQSHPRVQAFLRELLARYHHGSRWRVLSFVRAGFKDAVEFLRGNPQYGLEIIEKDVIPVLRGTGYGPSNHSGVGLWVRPAAFQIRRNWRVAARPLWTYNVQPLLNQLFADGLIPEPKAFPSLKSIDTELAHSYRGISFSQNRDLVRVYFDFVEAANETAVGENFFEWRERTQADRLWQQASDEERATFARLISSGPVLQRWRWRAFLYFSGYSGLYTNYEADYLKAISAQLTRYPPERGFGLIILAQLAAGKTAITEFSPRVRATLCSHVDYLAHMPGEDEWAMRVRDKALETLSVLNCNSACERGLAQTEANSSLLPSSD